MNTHPALPAEESAALTRGVTLLSVVTAAVLVGMKLAAWLASGSVALMASLADSGLDLIASLATFFAVRYAAAPPDAEHRFGHGKAEAFASLFQGGLVFASAALIGREAVVDLMAPHPLKAEGWAIGVMAMSTLLTGGLIAAQTRVLRRTGSVAVSGDRAHYASDLGSNLIALVGIAASAWFGVGGMDALAALLVAGVLLWGAIGVFRQAANQLLDHELSPEARGRIIELVSRDARIKGVHQLRTRAAGPYVHMQMHIDLDPELTLADAHVVLVDAEKRVLEEFPSADIIIHADPRGKAEPHGGAFAETSRAQA
ncbi:cation diffusion facilitator family transporter [Phenylobacterium sp. LjRoot225]|uniref:cation diffusion facilitator family transporter n=1 Tax=Phenylobacterium sp. LjRoot225 TaxID=3342285 RepID=UPI003ECD9533